MTFCNTEDKPYSLLRGVSYASQTSNHIKPNDLRTDMEMNFRQAPAIELSSITPDVSKEDMPGKDEEGGDGKKRLSLRKICTALLMFPVIGGVIALVVLGILFLPAPIQPEPPRPTPYCNGSISPTSTTSAQSNCPSVAASVAYQITSVTVSMNGVNLETKAVRMRNGMNMTLDDLWILTWSDITQKLTVQPVQALLTCNVEGRYRFEYSNDTGHVVYYQTVKLVYLGNLQAVRMTAIQYLKADGVSKAIYLTCGMKTGCRHGTIVPELRQGSDVTFIEQASCSYSFNNTVGGEVECTTDIDKDVWDSKDEVLCSLKPDDGVHAIVNLGRMVPGQTSLGDSCTAVSLTIGQPGVINCKRRIQEDIDISLEKKGFYFGNWSTLLTISGEGSKKALNNRLTMETVKTADLLDISITIATVHCSDKGKMAMNYSDGSRTVIDIDVIGMDTSCPDDISKEVHATRSFHFICSWCTGHDVTNVQVEQKEAGSNLNPFPISLNLPTKTEHHETNLTIKYTDQYGVSSVEIIRAGIGCRYGFTYVITLNSLEGTSVKEINVGITVPSSLYTTTFYDHPVVNERDTVIEFVGFLGCNPTEIEALRDGVTIPTSEILEEDSDIRDGKSFKIKWEYKPVTAAQNNAQISARVSFLPAGNAIPKTYSVSRLLVVLDNTLCALNGGCNVVHPSDRNKFIVCTQGGAIQAITSCPAGLTLVFVSEFCQGQCG